MRPPGLSGRSLGELPGRTGDHHLRALLALLDEESGVREWGVADVALEGWFAQ